MFLSESINTGIAFSYTIGLQVAENVNEDTNTVSPCFTPASFKARCIAAVPALNAAASSLPTKEEISF